MKKINVYNKMVLSLEGFGAVEIEETTDGAWQIDFFPRAYAGNSPDKLRIETSGKHTGDKYFQYIDVITSKLKKFEELKSSSP